MKKRILSVLLTLVMLIGLVSVMSISASADTVTYDLWVGGVQVTSANKDDITTAITVAGGTANGTATYDPESETLTLNGFSYTGEGYEYDFLWRAAIFSKNDLIVKVVGSNTVTASVTDPYTAEALKVSGALTITGDSGSTLTLTGAGRKGVDCGGNLKIEDVTVNATGLSGLCSWEGNITIDNATVYATATGSGIYEGAIIALKKNITIENSKVTATASSGNAISIESGNLISNTCTIKNSEVTISNAKCGMRLATYANLKVENSTLTITATEKAIDAFGGNSILVDNHLVHAGNDAASAVKVNSPTDATYANKYVLIEPVKYDLYIGGVQFTSGNLIIDSTDSTAISGSATYNPELNTLTLNNFQYSGPCYINEEDEYLYGALRVEGDNDLRIVFAGQNVIECTDGDERWGLYTNFTGDLHIKAETIDSCLTFIGGDVACGRVPVFDGNFVIYAGNNEANAIITAEDTFASQYYTYSYVRYEPTLMVTFDYGTLGSETKTVFKDETVTPPAPAFAGKVLVGWYTDSNFTTEFNFSDAITANTTIYAKFTAAVAKIEKTGTSGLVDTYTITYTDGTTTTFTVTNGEKGDKGDQGIQGIQGVKGDDGHTPIITIQNGYWYIDDVNTNQAAQGVKGDTGNGISDISKTSTNGLVDTYTITYTNGTTTTFTVTNGEKGDKGDQGIQGIQGVKGDDGHTPIITIQNGYWYIDGVNTNQAAQGVKGDTGNGISDISKTGTNGLVDTYTITYTNGTTTTFTVTNGEKGDKGDQGIQGIQGIQGVPGADGHTPIITIQNGYWYIDGVNTNQAAQGVKGDTGNGISDISKTGTNGLVDTYTITYTNGTTTIFTVTNGEKGDKGNTGAAGADGVGIAKIEKTSSDGNVDTYTITLTNGTTYTFTVTNGTNGTDGKDGVDGKDGTNGTNGVDGKDGANGTDGQTPYIGENGNWWIGDTDTGVKAAGDDGKDGAIIVATAVGGTALISNIALIAWTLIKKKRLF